jgi:hypothetical protein
MSDPTSTAMVGVTVTPRRPGFTFDGLEREVPRAWHPAGIGPTVFLEALSVMAPVVESFFIADTRRGMRRQRRARRGNHLLPRCYHFIRNHREPRSPRSVRFLVISRG